jgi:hypothetical protein
MSGKSIQVMISCSNRLLYDGIDLLMFTYSLRYWRFQLALPFLIRANLTKWGG